MPEFRTGPNDPVVAPSIDVTRPQELQSLGVAEPLRVHSGSSAELSDSRFINRDDPSADGLDGSNRVTTAKFFAILALAANYVGSNITSYFLGTALLYIAADLSLDAAEQSWLPVANSLTFACTAPCVGYLQDIFGRRNVLILGCLAGILGNSLLAGANNFAVAIVGSTFTGLGNSLGELTAIAAVAEIVPVNKRGLFLALNTIMVLPLTPSVLYTELLSNGPTWRWCFWICVIWNVVALLALVLTYFRLSIIRPSHEKRIATLKSIDYVGMALIIIGCALFLVALQSGGSVHPWTSAYVLVQLFIGLGLLVVLALWEWKGAKNPVIPFRLFAGQRIVGFTFLIAFIVGINYYVILTIGPEVLLEVFGPKPVTGGLYGLGPSLCLMLGATLVNILLTVFGGRARELLFVAAVIMTAFTGAQAAINPRRPVNTIVLSCFASFGVGGLLVPTSTIVTTACPQDLIGTAVALVASMRTIGGSIGYAILDNILNSHKAVKIPATIAAYVLKAGLPQSQVAKFVDTFVQLATTDPAKIPLIPVPKAVLVAAAAGYAQGYADSAKMVFYVSIAFGVVAIVLCLALPDIGKLMTGRVVAMTRR